MALLQLLSVPELIAQLVCFFAMLFILKKLAWKKILSFLDERKQKIQNDFAKLEKTRVDIERIQKEYETKMQQIDILSRQKIQEAIDEGRSLADDIHRRAEKDAEKIIQTAREEVQYEVIKAKNLIKDTVVDLTIRTTEMLLQEKVTEAQDIAMVKKFLDDVEKEKNVEQPSR